MNRIALIVGVMPPAVCGVGDYTANLTKTQIGRQWCLYSSNDWRYVKLIDVLKFIRLKKPNTIFIQYPAEGYGWSLVPHLTFLICQFILNINVIPVLHEYSSLSWKSRYFIDKIFKRAKKVVFTTSFELNNFNKNNPYINSSLFVIPILSNMPRPAEIQSISSRSIDLTYFGHIRPNKGLEDFVRVALDLMSINDGFKIKIIGQIPKGYEYYAESLRKSISCFDQIILLNADPEVVTHMLSDSKICFLPYPDGISERRGSFLAAIQCGAVVATYDGPWSTPDLLTSVLLLERGEESYTIKRVLSSIDNLNELQKGGCSYNSSRVSTWDDIAYLYEQIANK